MRPQASETPAGMKSMPGCQKFSPRIAVVCLTLFVGTLLLFSRTLQCGFLDLDDPDYVTANSHVRAGLSISGIRWAFTTDTAGNWHPLTWISHMLDWQLFGDDPRGHHAVNVIWHSFNAALAFLALLRLTKSATDANEGTSGFSTKTFWISAIAAALFAWHPLRVESVAWVSERKDVLSTFFGLLTLWLYAGYAEVRQERSRADECKRWPRLKYLSALICFALGLMCKSMLVTLPLLLLVLDWWPLETFSGAKCQVSGFNAEGTQCESRRASRLILEKIPFFLLSAIACLLTLFAQRKGGAIVNTLALHVRLENAFVSIASYIGKFFWPFNLAIGYPYPERWPMFTVILAALMVLALTVLAFTQRRRQPWLLAGWLWFLVMLLPVIGIVQAGLQSMADRYTYLPILGLQIALLWTVARAKTFFVFRRFGMAMTVVLFTACALRTWNQLGYWRNSHALFDHALAVTKGNYIAHCYSATTFFSESRFEAARLHFEQAIELKPDYASARFRLGLTLERLGRDDQALAAYEELLKSRPDDALGQFHCANVLARLDRDEEALAHYARAIDLNPDSAEVHCNYADSLRATKRFDGACAHYRRAITLAPENAVAFYGLGAALEDSGHTEEALASYRAAVRLKPDFASAYYDLGALLLNNGQPAEAIPSFRSAIAVRTNFAAAYAGLGLAEAQLNLTHAAVQDLERARELDSGMAGVSETLARLRENPVVNVGGSKP
jgi:tetratricopeptide (TPR) repeat protein